MPKEGEAKQMLRGLVWKEHIRTNHTHGTSHQLYLTECPESSKGGHALV